MESPPAGTQTSFCVGLTPSSVTTPSSTPEEGRMVPALFHPHSPGTLSASPGSGNGQGTTRGQHWEGTLTVSRRSDLGQGVGSTQAPAVEPVPGQSLGLGCLQGSSDIWHPSLAVSRSSAPGAAASADQRGHNLLETCATADVPGDQLGSQISMQGGRRLTPANKRNSLLPH